MAKRVRNNTLVFRNFPDYWYYARHLSTHQRDLVFNSLSKKEQERITASYLQGGWDDVFYRNAIDQKIEELKERYGYDLLDIKYKAMSGKSIFLPRKFWEVSIEEISRFKPKDVLFVIGGLKTTVCEANKDVVLIEKR